MKKPQVKKDRKLRNIEVLQLYNALKSLKGVQGIKLVYAINRTVNWLKPVVEAFSQEELIPMPSEFQKYQRELREFYEKSVTTQDGIKKLKTVFAPDGTPVEQLDVDFKDPVVIAGRVALDKKYDEVIREYQKEIDEYNQFLNKECEEEIKFYIIPLAYAPDKKEQFDAVAPLIREMTTEQQARWDELFAEISSE